MKASKAREIIEKKLKDMTPTKRDRFLSNCAQLHAQNVTARNILNERVRS